MYYTIKHASRAKKGCKLIPFGDDVKIFERNGSITRSVTESADNGKISFISLNPLMPVEILSRQWTKWNEPDIIKYKSASGGVYIVQDENLLADICRFMDVNGFKGRLPYLQIQGKEEWECYIQPENIHILEYLWAYQYNYDIYTCDGELVQEANNEERKFEFRAEYL